MAQLNVYVPDEIEEKVRKEAVRRGQSLSALIADLIRKEVNKGGDDWSKDFLELAGAWVGELPEIEKLAQQDRDWGDE